ncbi:MAG: methyltransferase family protein [Candidatus Limnocylindria bacterium]
MPPVATPARSRLPALGPRGEGWVAAQAVLFIATGLAGLAGPAWTGPMRTVSLVTGVALAAAGGALAGRGVFDLRGGLTPYPRPKADVALVDTGAYTRVRHPIYGGLILVAFGWGLITAAPLALAAALLLGAFFDLKSRREEAWLVERFPGYEAYRRRARRLIPWLY